MIGLLDGKVAIVTGAGRGIGRCHALALAAAGASVVVNDLGGAMDGSGSDTDAAGQVVQQIIDAGGKAKSDTRDIADWYQAQELVADAVGHFGHLDIVMNNAGIVRYSTILEEDFESWQRTLAVNLGGTAAMVHWAARYWQDAGPQSGRAIVNTCSPTATSPTSGCSAYSASKGAIATFTLTSAVELADLGVRVNAIVPVARTRMAEKVAILADAMRPVDGDFDRMAAEHAAQAALYLVSPLCQLTGRLFGIEGDDAWLYNSFSAVDHRNNHRHAWSAVSLAEAFRNAPPVDYGLQVAGSQLVPLARPAPAVLDALQSVARGLPVKLSPTLRMEQPAPRA